MLRAKQRRLRLNACRRSRRWPRPKSDFYTDAKPSIDTDPYTNPRAYANPNTYTHTCSDCDAYSDRNAYTSCHSSAFTHFSDLCESSGWHY
jgi:hypothetical protein